MTRSRTSTQPPGRQLSRPSASAVARWRRLSSAPTSSLPSPVMPARRCGDASRKPLHPLEVEREADDRRRPCIRFPTSCALGAETRGVARDLLTSLPVTTAGRDASPLRLGAQSAGSVCAWFRACRRARTEKRSPAGVEELMERLGKVDSRRVVRGPRAADPRSPRRNRRRIGSPPGAWSISVIAVPAPTSPPACRRQLHEIGGVIALSAVSRVASAAVRALPVLHRLGEFITGTVKAAVATRRRQG